MDIKKQNNKESLIIKYCQFLFSFGTLINICFIVPFWQRGLPTLPLNLYGNSYLIRKPEAIQVLPLNIQ